MRQIRLVLGRSFNVSSQVAHGSIIVNLHGHYPIGAVSHGRCGGVVSSNGNRISRCLGRVDHNYLCGRLYCIRIGEGALAEEGPVVVIWAIRHATYSAHPVLGRLRCDGHCFSNDVGVSGVTSGTLALVGATLTANNAFENGRSQAWLRTLAHAVQRGRYAAR